MTRPSEAAQEGPVYQIGDTVLQAEYSYDDGRFFVSIGEVIDGELGLCLRKWKRNSRNEEKWYYDDRPNQYLHTDLTVLVPGGTLEHDDGLDKQLEAKCKAWLDNRTKNQMLELGLSLDRLYDRETP